MATCAELQAQLAEARAALARARHRRAARERAVRRKAIARTRRPTAGHAARLRQRRSPGRSPRATGAPYANRGRRAMYRNAGRLSAWQSLNIRARMTAGDGDLFSAGRPGVEQGGVVVLTRDVADVALRAAAPPDADLLPELGTLVGALARHRAEQRRRARRHIRTILDNVVGVGPPACTSRPNFPRARAVEGLGGRMGAANRNRAMGRSWAEYDRRATRRTFS
jgi:hypothetical protein